MDIEQFNDKFTRYEVARILGARSLQLAMDAPALLKMSKEEISELNFDSLKIAEKELESNVLPITVRRPMPKKSEKTVKILSDEEIKEKLEKQAIKEKKDAQKESGEKAETQDIIEGGEIMEMAKPEDESEDIEGEEDKGLQELK